MGFTSIKCNVLPREESQTDSLLVLFIVWCFFKEISGMLFTSLVLALRLFRVLALCDVYFSQDFHS